MNRLSEILASSEDLLSKEYSKAIELDGVNRELAFSMIIGHACGVLRNCAVQARYLSEAA